MDRVTLVGVYGFLGFMLCRDFLEKGIEVTGVTFDEQEQDDFTEEKRLEIGRNSNFHETTEKTWLSNLNSSREEDSIILFSVYDLFMTQSENVMLENEKLKQFLSSNQRRHYKLIGLMPASFAFERESDASFFIDCLDQSIYIPTLYGPWQPENYLYQQYLSKQVNRDIKPSLSSREWTMDAIYIEDTVQEIIEIINEESRKNFLLRSEVENNWAECARVLSIETSDEIDKKKLTLKEQIDVRCLKRTTDVQTGLDLQNQHYRRITGTFLP